MIIILIIDVLLVVFTHFSIVKLVCMILIVIIFLFFCTGGICDSVDSSSKTFNTGIVTLVNYNSRVANAVAGLTFTHEIGHNFGSMVQQQLSIFLIKMSITITITITIITSMIQLMIHVIVNHLILMEGNMLCLLLLMMVVKSTIIISHRPCSREMMLTQIRNRGQSIDGMFILL